MVIKTSDTTELVALLSQGAQRFRALGDRPIWSSYRDGIATAEFIELSIEEINRHSISQASANELWGIFAPTCDWDDCVGDSKLGQSIFEAIERDLNYERAEPSDPPNDGPATSVDNSDASGGGRHR